jgi:hypothetical protein
MKIKMTQLAEAKNEKRMITLVQIDEYDQLLRDETGNLNRVNGSQRSSDDSRMAEVHGVEMRKALLALREQSVLYEFYKARLG